MSTIKGWCPNCAARVAFLSDETPENCECGWDWELGRVVLEEEEFDEHHSEGRQQCGF